MCTFWCDVRKTLGDVSELFHENVILHSRVDNQSRKGKHQRRKPGRVFLELSLDINSVAKFG
jgi:hypothetical protein